MAENPTRQGLPFVVSGPSGTGKTSIMRRVIERDPLVAFCVSHTTRPSRPGEREGSDYFFVDEPAFRSLLDQDRFLEWAEYQGHLYGTSAEAVEGPTKAGMDVILEVEVKGARQLRSRLAGAVFVFLLPPSMDVLEHRLRGRGSDAEEAIRRRLERAHGELREVHIYDYVLVNEDLEQTVGQLEHVIGASRLERDRMLSLWRGRFDFG